MPGSPLRVSRALLRRPRLVALAWLLLTVVSIALATLLPGRLQETPGLRPDAESVAAERGIDELLPGGPVILAVVEIQDGRTVRDTSFVAQLAGATGALRSEPGVVEVDDPTSGPGGSVAPDKRSLLLTVELVEGLGEEDLEALQDRIGERLGAVEGTRALLGGKEVAERQFAQQSLRDLARGETVALVLLFGLLLFFFGGVVGAGLPLLVALAAVTATMPGLLLITPLIPVSEYALNIVTLLGLGLAVDYALLIVARFREERAAGADVPTAAATARSTAGRAVVVSALTVTVALLGLLAFAEPLLFSLGPAGAIVALLAGLAAVTLVPALLVLWGHRIPPAPPRAARPGLLGRTARLAQRYPWRSVLAATGLLLLLAFPFTAANLEDSGPEALPADASSRQVDELVRDRFGLVQPSVSVIVPLDPGTQEVRDLIDQAAAIPGVRTVNLRFDVPAGSTVLDVDVDGETLAGPVAREAVTALRELPASVPLLVGGPAAEVVDYRASVAERLPLAATVVVLATLVLLFLLTGSVVIPLKALVMNLLSLGATLGVLVLIFQEGWLAPLLGVDAAGSVDLTTPVLVAVLAFGLSMDYEVFLLARVREAWDTSGDGEAAVRDGLDRSGRVVTAAAVCIIAVFLGFAAGQLLPLKALGVGMIVAIVLDVTIVRGVLLPGLMRLLGEWNWWAPRPLRRLRAHVPFLVPRVAERRTDDGAADVTAASGGPTGGRVAGVPVVPDGRDVDDAVGATGEGKDA